MCLRPKVCGAVAGMEHFDEIVTVSDICQEELRNKAGAETSAKRLQHQRRLVFTGVSSHSAGILPDVPPFIEDLFL